MAGTTLLLSAAGIAVTTTAGTGSADTPHVNARAAWTVYHGNALGSGVDSSGVTFSPATPAWRSPALDGAVFGEPLEATGRVYVATENDTIYALAADTGAIVWSTHVGDSGSRRTRPTLPCGDISPTVGITGTPVIDVARDEIFAVADEFNGSSSTHVLVGLNLYTGTTMLATPVDPPGQGPAAILQRTGLNLSNGNVVFGYGGNDGDCSTYHGWIVSAPEGGGTPGYYDTTGSTPNGDKGAVWMGGAAPEVDAAGTSGRPPATAASSSPYDGSDSVIELSPALSRLQLFAPTTWSSDNGSDSGPRVVVAVAARQRDDPPGRQVAHRLSAERGRPRWDRSRADQRRDVRRRRRRRQCGGGDRRVHAVRQRRPGRAETPRAR